MSQLTLFRTLPPEVVNVAQVPQRSPFRYPGGKTWLVPYVRHWLQSLNFKPNEFIEPFAGGAIVGLTVAFEDYANHVTLVELDDQVAAVWETILGRNAKWLANKVVSFPLSYQTASEVVSQKPRSTRQKAFQTILKNRTYHGGILANGSGMLKHGENGKGIHSRWYPETIKRRILNIAAKKNKFTFIKGDGLEVIRKNQHRRDIVFFIDPPYTAGGKMAGKRLYRFCEIDHELLFSVTSNAKGDCLLTYDDAPEVQQLARKYGFDVRVVAMQNTHLTKMTELLIGKNLSWLP